MFGSADMKTLKLEHPTRYLLHGLVALDWSLSNSCAPMFGVVIGGGSGGGKVVLEQVLLKAPERSISRGSAGVGLLDGDGCTLDALLDVALGAFLTCFEVILLVQDADGQRYRATDAS